MFLFKINRSTKEIYYIIKTIFVFYDAICSRVMLITNYGHAGSNSQFFHFAFLRRRSHGGHYYTK